MMMFMEVIRRPSKGDRANKRKKKQDKKIKCHFPGTVLRAPVLTTAAKILSEKGVFDQKGQIFRIETE